LTARFRHVVVRLAFVVAASAALSSAAAGADVLRSPFGPVVQQLLERTHGALAPCELVLASDTVCFTVDPATVAAVAETIEALVAESGGRLVRAPWRSGNGVHSVDLMLSDGMWGALEIWLREEGERAVSGMIRLVPPHRVKGP
jgi:hypothetical protein